MSLHFIRHTKCEFSVLCISV
uniref:Uncharacterized protein n=1 Tax=Anguilla anguilla TaxID=7936 RepID=A0A0E9PUY6_ANGAN